MHPDALKCTQGHTYSHAVHGPVKPLPGLFACANVSCDLYQVDKNTWSETEMSLATGADGTREPSELRPTTSESGELRCCPRTTSPPHPGAHPLGMEYSQPHCLCSTCSSCDHPPTSSTMRMNTVMWGYCGHKNRV